MPNKPAAQPCSLFAWIALVVLGCFVGTRTAADAASRGDSAASARDARARKPPLYLEVQASVRGPQRGPFVPEMTLAPRAQLALRARTSSGARVYMLHCDVHAALSVFPDVGGIVFRADQWVSLPAADMPIQVGREPGREAVYVIATRDRLDAGLDGWLAANTRQPQARCDGPLAALLAGRSAAPQGELPPTAAKPPARKLPYALRGVDVSSAKSATARAFAESDGVVVLRFAYTIAP